MDDPHLQFYLKVKWGRAGLDALSEGWRLGGNACGQHHGQRTEDYPGDAEGHQKAGEHGAEEESLI